LRVDGRFVAVLFRCEYVWCASTALLRVCGAFDCSMCVAGRPARRRGFVAITGHAAGCVNGAPPLWRALAMMMPLRARRARFAAKKML